MRARSLPVVMLALLATLACKPERAPVEPDAADSPADPIGEPPDNEHAFRYGVQTIYAYADPSLDGEVDRLFEVFATMRDEAYVIRDGGELPIGWTTLRFAVEGARITVLEPDYDGDPEHDSRSDISVSLATLARQRAVLSLAGVQGEAIDFDRHVLLVRGALEQDEVFLVRVESPGGRMTGWRLSPTSGMQPEDEVDSLPVHAILRARPELVDAMLLPAGYMAFYAGERLITLVDERDEVVWDWARDGELAPLGADEPADPEQPAGDPGLLPQLDR
ncbi:hypothetical protein ACNOYE_39245 [Nannocystaceae bacterium ST9]